MTATRKLQFSFGLCCIFAFLYVLAFLQRDWLLETRSQMANGSLGHSIDLPQERERPRCENILSNITDGKWVKKVDFLSNNSEEYRKLIQEEEEFDAYMNEFRIKRGIHTRLWRNDNKCGIKNLQTKPAGNHWGEFVGSWCDHKNDKPCCSDEKDGVCGQVCDCESCIDMRKIYHAEFSNWIPSDTRCMWRNYTAESACEVVRRFSEIHFVGDSFVRKMGRGFILLMRSDPLYGGMANAYTQEMSKLCVGIDQFYWTECRYGEGSFKDLLSDNRSFCEMDLSNFSIRPYPKPRFAKPALEFIKSQAGRKGSVLLLGVGGHMNCNFKYTIDIFVGPMVDYLNSYYKGRNDSGSARWPHIVFMYGDTPDVLKSPTYRPLNGKIPCYKFADQMKTYCERNKIDVLDFGELTSYVHSYDGTHHGLGVNIMKVQLFLNYLDSMHVD